MNSLDNDPNTRYHMQRYTLIRLILNLIPLFCFQANAFSQEGLSPVTTLGSIGNDTEVPLLLRIPANMIAKSVSRDFEHKGPVDQVILGTSSHGTSNCTGQVTCILEDNSSGVSILCRIVGTVESKTRGTNGPAIIGSTALTHYVSTTRLTFDGTQFASSPASVSSSTKVTITEIASSLPRLRGRLVTRIAARRAEESLTQVEAIVKSQTESELRQRIDADFAARVADMNTQFANKLSILKYFPGSQSQLQLSSSKNGVELALGHSLVMREANDESRAQMGEVVEVWLRRDENLVPNGPMSKILFSKAPVWLSTYLAENPMFLQADELKWGIDLREKWIVVKLY